MEKQAAFHEANFQSHSLKRNSYYQHLISSALESVMFQDFEGLFQAGVDIR